MIKNKLLVLGFAIVTIFIAGFYLLALNQNTKPPFIENTEIKKGIDEVKTKNIEVIADNLKIPWEIVFLPNGDILITERPGIIKKIGKDRVSYDLEGVKHIGEGGLLGMAIHPNFSENNWLYFYLTSENKNGLINRVERYVLEGENLKERKVIIDNIPGSSYHDGGRLAFGPDNYLYITTGDAGNPTLAQDINSLAGKILRLKDDGSIPLDNPFGNPVYSYGHRNPQGLAWDDKGNFWATEHGRSGIQSGLDELNLIKKGKNYGWPVIQGDEIRSNMESPILHSGSSVTWAPAGLAFLDGSLFFGGLRGESLYEARITGERKIELKTHFQKEFGRIRAVVKGPDGHLYITTSNTDGRGRVMNRDDKIIRVILY